MLRLDEDGNRVWLKGDTATVQALKEAQRCEREVERFQALQRVADLKTDAEI